MDKHNPDPVNGTANVDDSAIHGIIPVAGSGWFFVSVTLTYEVLLCTFQVKMCAMPLPRRH
jgi:hypothetical protein